MAGISKEVNEEILSKVKSGAKVVDVPKDYGVSTKTIYYWLRDKTESGTSITEFRGLRKEKPTSPSTHKTCLSSKLFIVKYTSFLYFAEVLELADRLR